MNRSTTLSTTTADVTGAAGLPAGYGLLVLLPDAQLEGVIDRLADRLALSQCTIRAAVPRRLEPSVVARMYRHNLGQVGEGRIEGSWLGRQMFTVGRSVVLVVYSPLIVDLPGTLARWKGPSAGADRSPGSLRAVVEYSNRCMSLLHSPDDAAQALEDANLLLGPELVRTVLDSPADRRISWRDVERAVTPVRPHAGLQPAAFLRRVVAKAVTELMVDARLVPWSPECGRVSPDGVADALWEGELAVGEIRYTQEPVTRVVPAEPYHAAVTRHMVDQRGHLVDVLRLIAGGSAGGMFAEHALRVLEDNGIVSDPWERHMLLTTLTFPPVSAVSR